MKMIKLSIIVLGLLLNINSIAQQVAPKGTPSVAKKPEAVQAKKEIYPKKEISDKKTSSGEKKKTVANKVPKPSKFSISAGAGIANYLGDLTKYNTPFNQSAYQASFAVSAGLNYQFAPHFKARFDVGYQQVQGYDSKDGGTSKLRNLSFKSIVFDFALSAEYDLLNMNKHRFSPYVFLGIGAFYFDPRAYYGPQGGTTSLRELGTEGQGLPGYRSKYGNFAAEFPVGLGLKYAVSKKVLVQAEFNYRFTSTDYLDDVSASQYPDKALLDARNPVTSKFTFRGSGEYPTNPGIRRGNSSKRDAYYTAQLKLVYKIKTEPVAKKEKDVKLPTADAVTDRDGDGIADVFDRCPDVPGLKYLQGCPDSDGDGVADIDDKCPDVAGFTRYQGCPIPDTDGDGTNDEMDKCPDQAGSTRYNGCPVPDTDGDGVNDEEDRCITEKGPVENYGCPVISQDIIDRINLAAKKIFFVTSSAVLLPQSFTSLNDVVTILNEHPSYKVHISGFTDSRGDVLMNQSLSEARAASVRDYIKSKGIDESRLTSTGYGKLNPVADNNTVEGQTKNRRVEMTLRNY